MYSHLSVPILLLVQTVTSFRVERPRECPRVFFFDFEKQVEQGEGGIWQGQEGEVTLGGGKAWLTGRGSLIYPFFSQNDLRPSFALSFKIKPARLANNDRVAIITNGRAPGTSTLTVFLNRTCIGVSVIETVGQRPSEESETRTVELSVDYTLSQYRMKRSSEAGDELSGVTETVPGPSNNGPSSVDSQSDTTGEGEDLHWEEDTAVNANRQRQREALKRIVKSRIPPDTVIAVRPLFNVDNPSYFYTWKKKTTTLAPATVTATTSTKYSTTRTTISTTLGTTGNSEGDIDPTTTTETVSSSSMGTESESSRPVDVNVVYEEDTVQTDINQNDTYSVSPVDAVISPSETISGELTTEETQGIDHAETTTIPQIKLSTSAKKTKSDNFPAAKPSVILKRPYRWRQVKRVHQDRILPSFPSTVEGSDQQVLTSYGGMDAMEEIDVRLSQDNGMLSLQVGDSAVQRTNIGSMEHVKAPRSALRVGEGDGLQPYRGTFDDFAMYDCAPADFFKHADSSSTTNVWKRSR